MAIQEHIVNKMTYAEIEQLAKAAYFATDMLHMEREGEIILLAHGR